MISDDTWVDEDDIDAQVVATYDNQLEDASRRPVVNKRYNDAVRSQVRDLRRMKKISFTSISKHSSLRCSPCSFDVWLNGDVSMSTCGLISLSNYCSGFVTCDNPVRSFCFFLLRLVPFLSWLIHNFVV